MSAEPSLTPINYARQAPAARRLLRRYWLPASLLVVLASAYGWGRPAWYRAQLWYWYSQAAAHETPDGTAVWNIWDGPGGRVGQGTQYVPHAWRRFYGLLSPPGFQSDGTAFLGEMRTPAGRRVLISVDVLPESRGRVGLYFGREPVPLLHVRGFTPGASWNLPKQFLDQRTAVPLPNAALSHVFAGKRDPADPTHFTIPFQSGSTTGVIDGWVRERRVDLEVRRGQPVTPPLPASPG